MSSAVLHVPATRETVLVRPAARAGPQPGRRVGRHFRVHLLRHSARPTADCRRGQARAGCRAHLELVLHRLRQHGCHVHRAVVGVPPAAAIQLESARAAVSRQPGRALQLPGAGRCERDGRRGDRADRAAQDRPTTRGRAAAADCDEHVRRRRCQQPERRGQRGRRRPPGRGRNRGRLSARPTDRPTQCATGWPGRGERRPGDRAHPARDASADRVDATHRSSPAGDVLLVSVHRRQLAPRCPVRRPG